MKMFYTLFLLGLGLFTGCSESPTDHEVEKPVLTVDDISCTEGWLNLSIPPGMLPAQVLLLQDNQTVMSITVVSADTLLYIPSLTHSKVYVFQASITPPNNSPIFSNVANLTTLSPTGNSFSWTKHYLGSAEINTSRVWDVAILSENDIWAVGQFVLPDTNLAGYSDYNAVHWDGSKWEYKQIQFYYSCQTPTTTHPLPIYSIVAFDSENITMYSTMQSTSFSSKGQGAIECTPITAVTAWASDSNNLYIGGGLGKIYHHNGTVWTLIETGTDLFVQSITGDYNGRTKSYEIMAFCVDFGNELRQKLLRIDGLKSTELSMQGITNWILEPWFIAGKKFYASGSALYYKGYGEQNWEQLPIAGTNNLYSVNGKGFNDIFVGGADNRLFHYNGVEWEKLLPEFPNSSYGTIKMKDNVVVAAGSHGNQGVITILKR
jgi:hypothetical protein